MPELPEVETIRRDLLPLVVGRTITEAWVSENAPRLVQLVPPEEFVRALPGHKIEGLSRRGKYLLINLDRGMTWGVHLRMTGRLLHSTEGCPDSAYLRAKFRLDDGSWLCFIDLRKFGTMWLVGDDALIIRSLGPEPLSDDFTPAYLHGVLKRRSAPVKTLLLDQDAIAGIGNIYADEALFGAGIRPSRAANTITKPGAARLHESIRSVLEEALGDRGSSFRDYLDASGKQGGHQLKVKVYKRTGLPCYSCGSEVRRTVVGGRSTHYCPKCQR